MRTDLYESILGTGIDQNGAVAGGEDFNIGSPRMADCGHEGHESARSEISGKYLMNVLEGSRQILR
jgi:hypothetical protein